MVVQPGLEGGGGRPNVLFHLTILTDGCSLVHNPLLQALTLEGTLHCVGGGFGGAAAGLGVHSVLAVLSKDLLVVGCNSLVDVGGAAVAQLGVVRA